MHQERPQYVPLATLCLRDLSSLEQQFFRAQASILPSSPFYSHSLIKSLGDLPLPGVYCPVYYNPQDETFFVRASHHVYKNESNVLDDLTDQRLLEHLQTHLSLLVTDESYRVRALSHEKKPQRKFSPRDPSWKDNQQERSCYGSGDNFRRRSYDSKNRHVSEVNNSLF